MTEMMRVIMTDAKEMKGVMTRGETIANEARKEAWSARQAALQAHVSIAAVESDVTQLKDSAITKENFSE
eukprot:8537817-Pyramimonas_sp.AAC.2